MGKQKSFDDQHFKDMIVEYLKKFGSASRSDINNLLMDKLSDVLSPKSKHNKIMHLLQKLRTEHKIKLGASKKWTLNL